MAVNKTSDKKTSALTRDVISRLTKALTKARKQDLPWMRQYVWNMGNHVLQIHTAVDSLLGWCIFDTLYPGGNALESARKYLNFNPILEETSFMAKVHVCLKMRLFLSNSDLCKNLRELNKLRNMFSHPFGNRTEINKYSDPQMRYKIYETLFNTYVGIRDLHRTVGSIAVSTGLLSSTK